MKKRIAVILFIVCTLVFSLFTGCAGQKSVDKQEKVSLEFFQQKKEVVDVFNKLISEFEAKNPNIKIEQVNSPDAQKVLMTRIATNDVPEILTTLPSKKMYQDMMQEGIFLDLTNEKFLKNVNQKVIDLTKYNDKCYALPMATTSYGIYYNMDIFKAQNINPPATYDELCAACDKLKAAGITPMAFYDKDATGMAQQVERTMGVMKNDITKSFKDAASGNNTQTNDYLKKIGDAVVKFRGYGQKDTLGIDTTQATSDFVNGKCAMIISGTWMLSDINKMKPNMNVELIPIPNIAGGTDVNLPIDVDPAVSISAKSKHPAEAKKFLDFLSSKEAGQTYANVDASPSAINGVTSDVKPFAKINAQLKKGKMFLTPSCYWPSNLRGDLAIKLQKLVNDKKVDSFVKDADDIIVKSFSSK